MSALPLAGLAGLLSVLLAPLGVGLLVGADRKLSAAMQLRIGPPLLQPLYDLTKLAAKAPAPSDRFVVGLVVAHVVLAAGAFGMVVAGGDLLASVLVLGAAQVLFILAATSVESPYAQLGGARELVLLVATEPLLVLVVIAYALVGGSFTASAMVAGPTLLLAVPTLGLTLAVLLAAALRKSPFDIATAHHGHQELVKGSTTEMSGLWLALAELGHWYEAALVLALIGLGLARAPLLAAGLVLVTYLVVVVVDNAVPRATSRLALATAWVVGGGGGLVALAVLAVAGAAP